VYSERASRVAGAVVWESVVTGPGRVLPDGCMDVLWMGGELVIAGPDTRAQVVPHVPGARCTGLRFAPGTAPGVLGVPAHELRDLRVPLADVWPERVVRPLAARVAEAPDPGRALEELVLRRIGGPDPGADPVRDALLRALGGGVPVAEAAALVGLSERQVHRRCQAAFGYGPKTLARVLRLVRALAAARAGTPLATVAVEAGYADQPHLARDVRALAGVPIGELL
jgi:AraC-like DNA-binding protein